MRAARPRLTSTTPGKYGALLAAALTLPQAAAAAGPKLLVSFNGANGNQPQSALVADAAGNLYGTSQAGGTFTYGTVFELSPPAAGKTAWTTKVLLSFNGTNGQQPTAGMVFDSSGNLYGTALTGGASSDGVVFELLPPAAGHVKWTEKVLHSFSGADGLNPQAGVIFDSAGNLYGAAVGGGADSAGTVFRLSPPTAGQTAWTITTLYTFSGSPDGKTPTGTLIMDKAGNIYGTTVYGGAASDGVAYKLSPPSGGGTPWKEKLLTNFSGANGMSPYAGMVFDSAGNLYGTAAKGGKTGNGTIYRLAAPAYTTEKTLLDFNGTNGNYPFANLAIDSAGNLFGVTGGGGKFGEGTLFELSPPTSGTEWKEKVLTVFTGRNGEGPSAAVLLNGGNVYGTTVIGGAHNDGTVFMLTP